MFISRIFSSYFILFFDQSHMQNSLNIVLPWIKVAKRRLRNRCNGGHGHGNFPGPIIDIELSQQLKCHTKLLLNGTPILDNFEHYGFARQNSSLAKSDLQQSSWPEVKFKEDFSNIFRFTFIFSVIFYSSLLHSV